MKVVKLQYIYKLLHDCSISVAMCLKKKKKQQNYISQVIRERNKEEKERKNALSRKTFAFLSRKPDTIEIISINDC